MQTIYLSSTCLKTLTSLVDALNAKGIDVQIKDKVYKAQSPVEPPIVLVVGNSELYNTEDWSAAKTLSYGEIKAVHAPIDYRAHTREDYRQTKLHLKALQESKNTRLKSLLSNYLFKSKRKKV